MRRNRLRACARHTFNRGVARGWITGMSALYPAGRDLLRCVSQLLADFVAKVFAGFGEG